MNLGYGMSVRTPYRPERLGDLAEAWIEGNQEPCLEAQRLHEEEVRARISRCVVKKRVSLRRWSKAPIATILTLRNRGFTLKEIATRVDLSPRTVCRILKKQSTVVTRPIPQTEAPMTPFNDLDTIMMTLRESSAFKS